ncbi:hypothetical protein CVD28_15465 [Bacillus sp. M6-12]|uniref:hypothetical protein n=1 Tax=Bacillus sp. M6-12 TaxID=2054166 RepID=UPI000C791EBC|nr:hypothetical protein [Bacillus sp. M6-12]PLS16485.1 hypothetical protein CVD28_15465 [Bacillus sp. M6-12]
MGLFEDIKEKFNELEDGRYVVRVEGFKRDKTIRNSNPIRWELSLMNDYSAQLPAKFSHVETNAGFQILLRELKNLGYSKPGSAEEFEEILNSLRGAIVEVSVTTTNKEEGYREVKFLRKLY